MEETPNYTQMGIAAYYISGERYMIDEKESRKLTRQAGRDARNEFYDTDILRRNRNLPLTAYFDPTAYGLTKPKLRPMKGAA